MRTGIGILIVLVSVLGGYAAMGGHLSVLVQPFEAVIILGAAVGAYVVANEMCVLIDTCRAIGALVGGRRRRTSGNVDLLVLMFTLFRTARIKGVKAIEADIERPRQSAIFRRFPGVLAQDRLVTFMSDYFRLVTLGVASVGNAEKMLHIESLFDEEIETLAAEIHRVSNALRSAADALPALGIVAAVMGMVHTMGNIDQPPTVLGAMIGGAMVGTFLGVLVSYGFVGPLASAIREAEREEIQAHLAFKIGFLAYLGGANPTIAVEHARKAFFSDTRPSFEELDRATSGGIRET